MLIIRQRVLYEPVVFPLMQTVQNRTKQLEKPQIKIGVRAHFEPDLEKRAHFEPDANKRVLIEPDVGKKGAY